MTSNAVLITVGACAGFALLVVLSVWSRGQALDALRRWAEAEGLELVTARRRSFVPLWCSRKGFLLARPTDQWFRVIVRDKDGKIRRAWVRCWDFNSPEPENIEVTWDERTSDTVSP